MSKLKKYLYIFLSLFVLFPVLVSAATELGSSTQSPVVGTDIYIQLDANYGTKYKIRDLHVIIKYDPSYLQFESVIWIQSSGNYHTENGRIYIDKDAGIDWNCGATLQLKFKVLKEGLSKVDVERNGDSHYTTGCDKGTCDVIGQSFAGVSINATRPSSSTIIGTLYVKGYTMQPTFSKTTYSYNLIVPSDVTSVDIAGTKGDNRQTITGLGKQELNYGDNHLKVVVSAQDGSSRTYEINVHRTDNRTGDTSLKSLSVSSTTIKYEEGKNTYEATVGRNTDNVLITARTSDPNATLIGTGRKNLNIGQNLFNLTVTSSGGKTSVYTIKINRSTEDIKEVEESSKLRSLKVNNLVLDLSDNKTKWLYGISKEYKSLSIDAIPESNTATVEITGNDDLKDGLNSVKIIVTENGKDPDSEAPKEQTEYTLIVYKNPSNVNLINDLSPTNITSDALYSTSSTSDNKLSKELIDYIKENDYKVYYNVVNMYNGLLFQALLSNNLPDSDLDVSFNKVSESPLTYQTSLPKGIDVILYLEDAYKDGTNVRIYTYNESGKYTLLTDGITIQNGYLSFTTNGEKNYVITTSVLIKEKGPIEIFFSKYKSYMIGSVVGLIAICYIISYISKKKKQKEKNEPLY